MTNSPPPFYSLYYCNILFCLTTSSFPLAFLNYIPHIHIHLLLSPWLHFLFRLLLLLLLLFSPHIVFLVFPSSSSFISLLFILYILFSCFPLPLPLLRNSISFFNYFLYIVILSSSSSSFTISISFLLIPHVLSSCLPLLLFLHHSPYLTLASP